MIEQATERRLAGDWHGACAAAGVDVTFDLTTIANEHGTDVATSLEDDLRHLAPDLLRWHLPRLGRSWSSITPDQDVMLTWPGGELRRESMPGLSVSTPPWAMQGPQRLSLNFAPAHAFHIGLESRRPFCVFWRFYVHDWSAARHLWDARHAGELRERCGGDQARAPFLNPDGTSRGIGELPTADPGPGEPAAHTEWVTALHDSGAVEAAFAAAGIELDASGLELDGYYGDSEPGRFLKGPLALTRLEAEIRRLSSAGAGDSFWMPAGPGAALLFETDGAAAGLGARLVEHMLDEPPEATLLPEIAWRRLPDLDLLRGGHIAPDHLHPLVWNALFPGRPVPAGPVGPPDVETPAPVRVRCRGEWHEVSSHDGDFHIPHDEEEQRREAALQALGGATAGCFAAHRAWRTGTGRLPKALRDQREEIFARAQHGDTPGVIRLLDAGLDPHVRNARQRTLLHQVHLLDHRSLLPRLLAAGLDVNTRDRERRTPLFAAVFENGSVDVIQALLTAGARVDLDGEIQEDEISLRGLIGLVSREDLGFLLEEIERAKT
jgi:hypothetical protein